MAKRKISKLPVHKRMRKRRRSDVCKREGHQTTRRGQKVTDARGRRYCFVCHKWL